ncbi:MAG: carboxylating nicotinate-nucleotide diphosphorylase [Xanthomonadales bacterium]|jgi:nicotinate-nucleotide pyrophosphorylase (carboxylating)|nr:carboxylating nicotinate-nucleotide diphosphorylase [Xanthomonadales bacterium]
MRRERPLPPPVEVVTHDVTRALAEDVGGGDVSAALLPDRPATAQIVTREAGVLAGTAWAAACFRALDPDCRLDWHAEDAIPVGPGDTLLVVRGSARALLTAERSALNFLQTLSATATHTARLMARIAHTRCVILDTRKTLPGLRLAQKYAVRCGGGRNHRIGLYDAILLKENHLLAAGSIRAAVAAARARFPGLPLEVEVETLAQLDECLEIGVPRVMLDNFSPAQARVAVAQVAGRLELEASGGIDEHTLVQYAEAGVDYISVGALTKHIHALDLSMRLTHD